MTPDILARTREEAEQLLREAGLSYELELTRPTRHFFKTDEARLYVVRVREEGRALLVTLAAKQCPHSDFQAD